MQWEFERVWNYFDDRKKIKINNNRDTRIEVCSECQTQWPHDVVSVVNMLQISARLITGEGRPAWLDRKSVVYNKGSGVK